MRIFILFIVAIALILRAFLLTAVQEKTNVQILAYSEVITSVLLTTFLFVTAFGLGSWFFRFSGLKTPRFRLRVFFATALGLGAISLIVLVMGAPGLLRRTILLAVLSILFLSGIPFYAEVLKKFSEWWQGIPAKSLDAPTLFAVIFITLLTLLYLVCALPLPVNYDVLEYHLGSLLQSLQGGSISPQPHVFYSHLPFGIEALYAAGLVLEKSGQYLTPKLINFGLWLLASFGIYLLGEQAGFRRAWRLLGVILFGMNCLVFSVGLDAFVELGQSVYVLGALICWFLWWRKLSADWKLEIAHCELQIVDSEKRKREGSEQNYAPPNLKFKTSNLRLPIICGNGWLRLAFVFWGLALGVKYSILGIGILPFFIFLLPVGLIYRREWEESSGGVKGGFLRAWILHAVLGVVIIALTFSPWMVRSFYHTHNPVFPFLSGIFHSPDWTPQQMAYYVSVNREVAPLSLAHIASYIEKWRGMGALYVLPLLLVPFLFARKKWVLALFGFVALCYGFWNLFIQTPVRFMVPIIPVVILLVILVLRRLAEINRFGVLFLLPYIIFFAAAFQMHCVEVFNIGYAKAALFCFEQSDFLEDQLGAYKAAADFINKELPPDTRLLFLYEARTFYVNRPVTTNTVFDRSLLLDIAASEPDAQAMRNRLIALGYTHILMNEVELNRLIHFYAPKETLGHPGISPLFQDPDANLTAFDALYGPYHFDGRYQANRKKIREFLSSLQRNIIFERADDRGLRFYISSLK